MSLVGRELRSSIDDDGSFTLSLETNDVGEPAADEIVVRVEATPINPSDLGMLLGPVDLTTLAARDDGRPGLTGTVPRERLAGVVGRIGQAMPVGNEGAGTVVATGRDTVHLAGRRVGMIGGGMYADYRRLKASDAIPLPPGATAADGASMFVNPLTALGFVETARAEGHTAIVHTAAASNLGQMLQKICRADSIPLINIVRSPEQVELLRAIGATHVLNSKDDDFADRLTDAVAETGATIAFDAVGGGTLGARILEAMERAAVSRLPEYNRYGSDEFKQLYIYGGLNTGPTMINRARVGFHWSIGGWLLFPFLKRAGDDVTRQMRARVVAELTTTFASRYTRTIGLAEALDLQVLRAYERKGTGEKFLIDPGRDAAD